MARRGENIHKRKDGRWEGRYIKARTPDRRICWGYVYNVRIYQNVTLGRADVYKSEKDSPSEFKGFLLKEGACICAGAKLICKKGTLVIGKNAVVGANAVLLNSIGDNEIWGGVPARFIGMRKTSDNEM